MTVERTERHDELKRLEHRNASIMRNAAAGRGAPLRVDQQEEVEALRRELGCHFDTVLGCFVDTKALMREHLGGGR